MSFSNIKHAVIVVIDINIITTISVITSTVITIIIINVTIIMNNITIITTMNIIIFKSIVTIIIILVVIASIALLVPAIPSYSFNSLLQEWITLQTGSDKSRSQLLSRSLEIRLILMGSHGPLIMRFPSVILGKQWHEGRKKGWKKEKKKRAKYLREQGGGWNGTGDVGGVGGVADEAKNSLETFVWHSLKVY